MNNLKLKNKGTLYSTIEQFGTIYSKQLIWPDAGTIGILN